MRGLKTRRELAAVGCDLFIAAMFVGAEWGRVPRMLDVLLFGVALAVVDQVVIRIWK